MWSVSYPRSRWVRFPQMLEVWVGGRCVITAAGFSQSVLWPTIVCGVIEMFMECLFIYISMTWNIHIRFSWLHVILIGNGSSKRVSSTGRLRWRGDLFRSGPVWIRKKSNHDFPLLSYANWVAGIWIWNWTLSWVILIWENWGKDSFCWVEWLTLALNGAFKISYWGWIMHNYNLQQAVKSQPPRLTVHPKS